MLLGEAGRKQKFATGEDEAWDGCRLFSVFGAVGYLYGSVRYPKYFVPTYLPTYLPLPTS